MVDNEIEAVQAFMSAAQRQDTEEWEHYEKFISSKGRASAYTKSVSLRVSGQ